MDTKSKLFMMAISVSSLVMAPSLFNINAAYAVSNWCEQQGMSNNWINGCKVGWSDHDKCQKYNPIGDTKEEVAGYKAGWNHGSCKKLA